MKKREFNIRAIRSIRARTEGTLRGKILIFKWCQTGLPDTRFFGRLGNFDVVAAWLYDKKAVF
jgi:hypothetical protein